MLPALSGSGCRLAAMVKPVHAHVWSVIIDADEDSEARRTELRRRLLRRRTLIQRVVIAFEEWRLRFKVTDRCKHLPSHFHLLVWATEPIRGAVVFPALIEAQPTSIKAARMPLKPWTDYMTALKADTGCARREITPRRRVSPTSYRRSAGEGCASATTSHPFSASTSHPSSASTSHPSSASTSHPSSTSTSRPSSTSTSHPSANPSSRTSSPPLIVETSQAAPSRLSPEDTAIQGRQPSSANSRSGATGREKKLVLSALELCDSAADAYRFIASRDVLVAADKFVSWFPFFEFLYAQGRNAVDRVVQVNNTSDSTRSAARGTQTSPTSCDDLAVVPWEAPPTHVVPIGFVGDVESDADVVSTANKTQEEVIEPSKTKIHIQDSTQDENPCPYVRRAPSEVSLFDSDESIDQCSPRPKTVQTGDVRSPRRDADEADIRCGSPLTAASLQDSDFPSTPDSQSQPSAAGVT